MTSSSCASPAKLIGMFITARVILSVAMACAAIWGALPDAGASVPHGPRWQPPLGAPMRISAPYDLANGPYQAGHRGIDLPASAGATVVAPGAGVVTFVGTVADRPLLTIQTDDRTLVSLEPLESGLAAGDSVTRGQPVGTVATGGHCGTDCLHIGVRIDGTYVNPLRFFMTRARLVPW